MDYLLSYDKEDAKASRKAQEITLALKNKADNITGDSNRKARLTEADFLLILFNKEEDFNNKEIMSDWQFFLDELKWKRKKNGVILILCPPEVNFIKLPLRLRNCYYFNYGEEGSIYDFMEQNEPSESLGDLSAKAMPPHKEIKYVPHEQQVVQIEFSARAPSVDSFDGTINYDTRETGGCKDDHVYKQGNKTSHITEELERPGLTSVNSVNSTNPAKRKRTTCGCVASIFAALFLIAILTIIIVLVTKEFGFLGSGSLTESLTQGVTQNLNNGVSQNAAQNFNRIFSALSMIK